MERARPATAVVVDDWPLLRLGIAQALAGSAVTVVGAAGGAEEGLHLARARGADVLVLGACRDLAPAEAARRARELPAPPRVVVLVDRTGFGGATLAALRTAGVAGLLERGVGAGELAGALARVAAGERVVAPALLSLVLEVLGPGGGDGAPPAPAVALTPKEGEVLAELCRGRANRDIAAALFVTPATVKTHLGHIYEKLGVTTRQEAVARAVALGLLR